MLTGGGRRRCTLRIFSGRIIYNRAMPGGLRTARHCIFTGGVVEVSGLALSVFASQIQLSQRESPWHGGKLPDKSTKWMVSPEPLPLGEVSPKVTERARPLRKSAGGTERTLSVIAARCHLPRRGRFCSACRQITKSSPFGGAGCDHREQTERVPLDISPLLHYNTSKMNHSKMKGWTCCEPEH